MAMATSLVAFASAPVFVGPGLPAGAATAEASGVPVVATYDMNPRPEQAVYLPSSGTWRIPGRSSFVYGDPGDIAVPGTYDRWLVAKPAVFRPSTGDWWVQGNAPVHWGTRGDIPEPAAYLSSDRTDMTVFRPSTGTWFVRGTRSVAWGTNGDIPAAADYTGDGRADLTVFRPSNGRWYVHGLPSVQYGTRGDVPAPADFNGDGVADMAVFRPSSGTWYIRGVGSFHYGAQGDIPAVADYDQDGHADAAVYRPSTGRWYVRASNAPDEWTMSERDVTGASDDPQEQTLTTANVSDLRPVAVNDDDNTIWGSALSADRQFYPCVVDWNVDTGGTPSVCANRQSDLHRVWSQGANTATALPIISGNYLVVAGGYLSVLRASDGSVVWTDRDANAQVSALCSPIAVGGRMYYVEVDRTALYLVSRDVVSGRIYWRVPIKGGCGMAYANSTVYLAGDEYSSGGVGYAVADGHRVWGGWATDGMRAPIVVDGLAFQVSSDSVAAFPASCGSSECPRRWLRYLSVQADGFAAYANGRVFVMADHGHQLLVLNGTDGSLAFTGTLPPDRTANDNIAAYGFAAAGDLVFTTTQQGLILAYSTEGCGATTCAPVWTSRYSPFHGGVYGHVVEAGGVLYAPNGLAYRVVPSASAPYQLPGRPTNVTVSDNCSGDIRVAWKPPSDTGGLPLTGATVYLSDGTVASGTPEFTDLYDVPAGTTFRVSVQSADGSGPVSATTAPYVPCGN